MDTEEKRDFTTVLTTMENLKDDDREKIMWVIQGMIIAGQSKND